MRQSKNYSDELNIRINSALTKMNGLFANMYETGFKGEKRNNEIHESKTDPDVRLYRKGGTASELCYMDRTLSDNRHGLVTSTAKYFSSLLASGPESANASHIPLQFQTQNNQPELNERNEITRQVINLIQNTPRLNTEIE